MRSKPLLGLVMIALAACGAPPERLTVEDKTVIVYNDTGEAWTDVEIWVNDHYRATRERIAPGERFEAPLAGFVAGFGQRFPPDEPVTGVNVGATAASGIPVRLVWGGGRRQ